LIESGTNMWVGTKSQSSKSMNEVQVDGVDGWTSFTIL